MGTRAIVLGCGLVLWAHIAGAQTALVCDPLGGHNNYRTQNTLVLVNDGSPHGRLYVGVENKGVYLSTDGGATWVKRDAGLKGYPRLGSESERCLQEMGRIVADPLDPEHLYLLRVETAGTLEMFGSENAGIYETTDGGLMWRQLSGYSNASGSYALAVVPNGVALDVYMGTTNRIATWNGAPETLYNTNGVLFRSTDSGATWTELDQRAPGEATIPEGFSITQVYVDSTRTQIWAAVFVRERSGPPIDARQIGFLESTDGGVTWTRGTSQLPDATARQGLNGHVAPANFDHRLLSTSSQTGQSYSWYTRDGSTWAKTGRYVYVARYSPHDATGDTLYGYDPFAGARLAPAQGILKSVNGGRDWTKIAELPVEVDNGYLGASVRISNFVFHPTDPLTMYMSGSNALVWKSTDGGDTWTTILHLQHPAIGGPNSTTPTPPGAPGAPTATVAGTAVSLSWTPTTTGGLASSYVIETATDAAFSAALLQTNTASSATTAQLTRPEGMYYVRVIGVNAVGNSPPSAASTFTVAAPPPQPPGPPGPPAATVTGTSVALSWAAPTSGGAVLSYIVQTATDSGFATRLVQSSTASAATITQRIVTAPGTYFVRVIGVNAVGNGTPSPAGTFTIEAAPQVPGPPGQPVVTVSGNDVTVTWTPPTTGGAPTGYSLEVGTAAGSRNVAVVDMETSTSGSGGLPSGVYFVRVTARNGAGTGPPSIETSFATGVAPGAPTQLSAHVEGSVVTLLWSRPASGGAPTGYILEAGTSSGLTDVASLNIGPLRSLTTHAPNGTYFVRLRAFNGVASSAPSNEVSFSVGTSATPPNPPTGLTSSVSGNSVALSWSAPVVGSAPAAYRLEAGSAPGLSDVAVLDLGTPATTYTARSVPGGTYHVRVRGRTPAGLGLASDEIVVTVP